MLWASGISTRSQAGALRKCSGSAPILPFRVASSARIGWGRRSARDRHGYRVFKARRQGLVPTSADDGDKGQDNVAKLDKPVKPPPKKKG